MLRVGAVALILTFSIAVPSARADHHEAPPRWELGLFGGYHFTSDTNELGVADVMTPDAFDDSWGLGLRAAYAFMPLLSAEAEVVFLPTDTILTETDVMPIGWRVHALAHILGPDSKIRPFAVAGFGAFTSTSTNTQVLDHDTDALFHAGVGLKLELGDRWGLRADARILFPPSTDDGGPTTDFEVFAGVLWRFGAGAPADADGDGIADSADKCPDEPENMNGVEDDDGCPEAEDPDGDGIVGAADRCPDKPEDVDQHEDTDGCPDEDNDGDGIPDGSDQCPMQAETANGIDDEDGCPEGDEDGDGLVGSKDQCPTDPEDKDGHQDDDGCPDPDNDGDGVPDTQDKCQGELETKNGYEDDDGCPDEVPKAVKKFSGTIKGIKFKTNSAVILRRSNRTLDEAVKVMNEYPTIRIEIQGHTDAQADDAYNLKLSQDRADAVKAYLVSKGIDESRLVAKGYGETQPVADNETNKGRQQNRRVDFRLISQLDQPATQPTPAPEKPEPETKEPEEPESEE